MMSESRNKRIPSGLTLLTMALLGNMQIDGYTAHAAEAAAESQEAPLLPDIELLEFLGSFQTDNGEWIAPESLLGEEFEELFDLADRMDQISNSENNGSNSQQGNQQNDAGQD